MLSVRNRRATAPGWPHVALAIGIAMLAIVGTAGGVRSRPPAKPAVPAPDSVVVRETRVNLQQVFAGEMNAKERYAAAAKQADRDGFPAVAALFRACSRAEEIHADRHVTAIAWGGDEARVLLDRLPVGTTVENLQAAVERENYEATRLYPALLARARAEHLSKAVRSMNLALAVERTHARLFETALATLDRSTPAPVYYVCPWCGNTVTSLDFDKCPNCFTRAKRFIRVT
jgi:rubrerythrin